MHAMALQCGTVSFSPRKKADGVDLPSSISSMKFMLYVGQIVGESCSDCAVKGERARVKTGRYCCGIRYTCRHSKYKAHIMDCIQLYGTCGILQQRPDPRRILSEHVLTCTHAQTDARRTHARTTAQRRCRICDLHRAIY